MNISNISILNITLGIHYIIRSSIRFNIMMEHIFHPFEAYLTISNIHLGFNANICFPDKQMTKNEKPQNVTKKTQIYNKRDKNLVNWLLHRRTKSLFWCLRNSLQAWNNLYERYKTFSPSLHVYNDNHHNDNGKFHLHQTKIMIFIIVITS